MAGEGRGGRAGEEESLREMEQSKGQGARAGAGLVVKAREKGRRRLEAERERGQTCGMRWKLLVVHTSGRSYVSRLVGHTSP